MDRVRLPPAARACPGPSGPPVPPHHRDGRPACPARCTPSPWRGPRRPQALLSVEGVEEPVTFWISRGRYEVWSRTRLIVDVVPGRGSGFSLEAPESVRFLTRSRVVDAWSACRPPESGALALPEGRLTRHQGAR
ncbi:DUF779 domain-containing protein [Streptomyces dangxiongensis]|uniref:DUF779 domain-containing protein n=1 Tax=Streptomyces dangxiongensis TaxID=1442032 RepID=A0A3G2JNF6_9ACTN|nr:DUF779 domain-containing protein [Streptomyces dangxiongensis]